MKKVRILILMAGIISLFGTVAKANDNDVGVGPPKFEKHDVILLSNDLPAFSEASLDYRVLADLPDLATMGHQPAVLPQKSEVKETYLSVTACNAQPVERRRVTGNRLCKYFEKKNPVKRE